MITPIVCRWRCLYIVFREGCKLRDGFHGLREACRRSTCTSLSCAGPKPPLVGDPCVLVTLRYRIVQLESLRNRPMFLDPRPFMLPSWRSILFARSLLSTRSWRSGRDRRCVTGAPAKDGYRNWRRSLHKPKRRSDIYQPARGVAVRLVTSTSALHRSIYFVCDR